MSIIERAIDKAAGVKTPAENDSEATKSSDSEKRSALIEAFRPDNAPESAAANAAITKPNKVDDVVEEIPKADIELDRQTTNSESEFGAKTKAVDPESENYVHIDFERLTASSYLTPDVGLNGQSEEYQQIKRRLLGNMVAGMAPNANSPNLIMVTSSVPSEGKTFTSVNLAMSIAAEIDHTVLAIDADIAKRDLTRAFNALGRPGIFDVLSDDSLNLSDVMLRTNIPNFVLIPAGLNSEASTELLASVRMHEICLELAHRYKDRVVLFDTPPILATSAALALAPKMGQVILVVEAGKTKQETLSEALGLIDESRITGLILNKSRQQRRSAYDYYGYYYQKV